MINFSTKYFEFKYLALVVWFLFVFSPTVFSANMNLDDTSTVFVSKTVIDAPIEKVWPHAINYKAWMENFDFEVVSGTENTVGAITKVIHKSKRNKAPSDDYHYYENIDVIPLEEVVARVWASSGGVTSIAFDMLRTKDLGNNRTEVSWHSYWVTETPGATEKQKKEMRAAANSKSRHEKLKKYWENLKANVMSN